MNLLLAVIYYVPACLLEASSTKQLLLAVCHSLPLYEVAFPLTLHG